jgi:hypothetical protein
VKKVRVAGAGLLLRKGGPMFLSAFLSTLLRRRLAATSRQPEQQRRCPRFGAKFTPQAQVRFSFRQSIIQFSLELLRWGAVERSGAATPP